MLRAIRDVSSYRITRKIAEGGMGTVYEAVQDGAMGFRKTVAVKTLLPQLSDTEQFVEMFIQEAKLVANLVHENIVQIYQLGRTPEGWYIVMEYVNGLSLHEFIRFHKLTRSSLPQPLAVFITSRIARGLAYAHSRADNSGMALKIVHRDVCPNNVLITTEGLPKLTDFGIALVMAHLKAAETRSLMGKLTYMSPEQARKKPVDFRTDLFALGAVLFELLSGNRIRLGRTQEEATEMAKAGYVQWEGLPDTVPEDLRRILERCMAFNPGARYESTKDLAKELEYYIYKDGYGPTIQTLEEYLRRQFPYLYQVSRRPAEDKPSQPAEPPEITATIILD